MEHLRFSILTCELSKLLLYSSHDADYDSDAGPHVTALRRMIAERENFAAKRNPTLGRVKRPLQL